MGKDEPTLEMLLDDAVWAFALVRRRHPLLLETLQQLQRLEARFEKQYHNDGLLQVVLDSFDMLVIDLCSVREALLESNGVLNCIRRTPTVMRRRSAAEFVASDASGSHEADCDDFRSRRIAADINGAIGRLFGPDDPVAEHHVRDLVARFRKDTEGIYRDRNRVRAHRYERGAKDGSHFFIPLSEIEAQVVKIEAYLRDLYLAITAKGFAMDMDFSCSSQTAAEDLADIIVHGSINRATLAYGMVSEDCDRNQPPPWYWAKREAALVDPAS